MKLKLTVLAEGAARQQKLVQGMPSLHRVWQ